MTSQAAQSSHPALLSGQYSKIDKSGQAEAEQGKRTLYFDVLNVLACFCVVAIHFNGSVWGYADNASWKQALFVEVICYWAVPIFFMLSGATLMTYRHRYDTKSFFHKRIARVFIPFLIWNTIAIIWRIVTSQMPTITNIAEFISVFVTTEYMGVYWFFVPLFAVYLCIPVLSLLVERVSREILWYFAGLTFLTLSAFPLLCHLFGITYNQSLEFPLGGGFLLYVILGYLLSTEDLNRSRRVTCYALGVFAIALRYFGTIYLSNQSNQLDTTLWGYHNVPAVFLSVAIFVLFKSIKWDQLLSTESIKTTIAKISGCSFGIYLIHAFLIWHGLQITSIPETSLRWRIVGPIVGYILCLALVLLAKRIPIIRKLVP